MLQNIDVLSDAHAMQLLTFTRRLHPGPLWWLHLKKIMQFTWWVGWSSNNEFVWNSHNLGWYSGACTVWL